MFQRGIAEKFLLAQDGGIRELQARRRDLDVAFGHFHESQQSRRFHDGQQIVDLKRQQVGHPVDVLAAIVIGEDFQKSGDAAGAGVREHRVFRASDHRLRRDLRQG